MNSLSFNNFILWIAILYLNIVTYEGKHLCTPCYGKKCRERKYDCLYGDIETHCNEYVCARGPNEQCSKHAGGKALCQEGLMCDENLGICIGCLQMPNGLPVCSPNYF